MDTIFLSNIIKIISVITLLFFSYKLIRLQQKQKSKPRKKMIMFLLSAVFVIVLEYIKTFFNTDNYMIWVSFQHLNLFSASLLHLFLLDWSISLKAAAISNQTLQIINKESYKFLIIPFILNTIFMFFSFTFLRNLLGTGDCTFAREGYLIIIFFFKVEFLFITLLSYLFFPDIKNLVYLKKALFFLLLSRISNLVFYAINRSDLDDFTKYIFILPAVILGSIGVIKILKDKKKSCAETQPFNPNCKDD
jgi:hypothetical protein